MLSIKNHIKVNPSDKVEIDKSIFIWIDIVGFSNAVDDEKRYEELSELLTKVQSLFNDGDGYSATIISDGIILQLANPKYQKIKRYRVNSVLDTC